MGLSSGPLGILIANRQGAEDFMSRARMEELQQAAHLDSALVDYCHPAVRGFPQGGLPGHLSARHTTRFRLPGRPKTFPSGRTQSASASLGERLESVPEEGPASANAMLERFPKVHARA